MLSNKNGLRTCSSETILRGNIRAKEIILFIIFDKEFLRSRNIKVVKMSCIDYLNVRAQRVLRTIEEKVTVVVVGIRIEAVDEVL
jgi:hypothetical protein